MKSQDIGLLLKLVATRSREGRGSDSQASKGLKALPDDWRDWALDDINIDLGQDSLSWFEDDQLSARYSVRALAKETGISKSQVSLALQRCLEIGLIRKDRKTGVPRTNTRALFNFILHGVRYVFPARPGEITRGIATTFAAPVLEGQLYSSGELVMVWPDARGNSKGQAIEPLFKSVPYAVRRDRELYAMLALVDAIRLGHPRESKLAAERLAAYLE
jgi:hypothetical protein